MERTEVSNQYACKIVNALMKNSGFDSPVYVLNPAKLKCQRKHWREQCTEEHTTAMSGLGCLGFDGRVDTTRSLVD